MSGGWKGSDRRDRLPDDWSSLRALVFARDGYRCRQILPDESRCPEAATDVDHVERGDDHRMENLQSLCDWHHKKKSGREGGQAAAARRPTQRRRPERHPGLI